jgi:hypothetical protein
MSNIGLQRTSSKQNQQFNELLVNNNITTKCIQGFSDSDLLINSYSDNLGNYKNIILNDGIMINKKGDLTISRNIQLLDINSLSDPVNLYNDENNLIWGTDVVITDGTLQREVENLKLEELNSNRIILSSITDTNTDTINQNKVSLKVSSSFSSDEENNYSIILPSRKPQIGDILVVIDEQGNTDWIPLSKLKA